MVELVTVSSFVKVVAVELLEVDDVVVSLAGFVDDEPVDHCDLVL